MGFTIYVLKDPRTSEIRYIGKTTGPLAVRRQNHITDARNGRATYVYNWMRTLLTLNLLPLMEPLETGNIGDGSAEECKWIAHGRKAGWRLTNLTTGGEGKAGHKVSKMTCKKISDAMTERFKNPASREALAETTRKSWDKRKSNANYKAYCEKKSADDKARLKDPKEREKIAVATRKAMARREVKQKISAGLKARFADPTYKAQHSERIKAAWKDPEKRDRIVNGMRSCGAK